jgi:hypothetical protein
MSEDSLLPPAKPYTPKRIRGKRNALKLAKIQPKPGPLSSSEISIIDSIRASTNDRELVPAQIDSVAIALRKDPASIAKYVLAAKEKFAQNASKYADLHYMVAQKAAMSDEPRAFETARKAAEFSMLHTSTKDAEGNEIRVISSPSQSSNAPVIKIGIALGGLPSKRNDDE